VADPFVTRVVGVSFCEGYPESLLRARERTGAGEVAPVRLIRDKDNPYDPNAVNVVCVAAGGRIGRIDKKLAPHVAGRIDAGEAWEGEIVTVMVNATHPEKPGVLIQCWPVGGKSSTHPGGPKL